jgi:DNA-binding NtrC family response regulator
MASIRLVVLDSSLKPILKSLLKDCTPDGTEPPELLIVELTGKPDCRGAIVVRELRSAQPKLPVIAVARTDHADLTQQAVRLCIDDFFRLPEESRDFEDAAAALLSGRTSPSKSSTHQNVLLGDSLQIANLRKYVARVAMTDSSVLITGETGTGKELVAELIHRNGARREKPFVCINSAALPDSLIESELFGFEKGAFTGAHANYQGKLRTASGGTIFLDEVGDLSLGAQAKILRALESREVYPLGGWRSVSVNIRVIAATNREMDSITESGQFRKDLFYRLNVVRIELPPLRDRKEDIPQLLGHFIGVFNRQLNRRVEAFHRDAVELLQSYNWPGNIRELRNVVEASFVNAFSDRLEVMDLPERLRRALEDRMGADSRARLMRALLESNWNITRTADALQCSRMTVYRKIAQHRISKSSDESVAMAAKV